jgi:hypothetical protein
VYGTLHDDSVNAVSDQANPIPSSAIPNEALIGARRAYSPTAIGTPTISASSNARPNAASPWEPSAAIATAPIHTATPAIARRASRPVLGNRAAVPVSCCASLIAIPACAGNPAPGASANETSPVAAA